MGTYACFTIQSAMSVEHCNLSFSSVSLTVESFESRFHTLKVRGECDGLASTPTNRLASQAFQFTAIARVTHELGAFFGRLGARNGLAGWRSVRPGCGRWMWLWGGRLTGRPWAGTGCGLGCCGTFHGRGFNENPRSVRVGFSQTSVRHGNPDLVDPVPHLSRGCAGDGETVHFRLVGAPTVVLEAISVVDGVHRDKVPIVRTRDVVRCLDAIDKGSHEVVGFLISRRRRVVVTAKDVSELEPVRIVALEFEDQNASVERSGARILALQQLIQGSVSWPTQGVRPAGVRFIVASERVRNKGAGNDSSPLHAEKEIRRVEESRLSLVLTLQIGVGDGQAVALDDVRQVPCRLVGHDLELGPHQSWHHQSSGHRIFGNVFL